MDKINRYIKDINLKTTVVGGLDKESVYLALKQLMSLFNEEIKEKDKEIENLKKELENLKYQEITIHGDQELKRRYERLLEDYRQQDILIQKYKNQKQVLKDQQVIDKFQKILDDLTEEFLNKNNQLINKNNQLKKEIVSLKKQLENKQTDKIKQKDIDCLYQMISEIKQKYESE